MELILKYLYKFDIEILSILLSISGLIRYDRNLCIKIFQSGTMGQFYELGRNKDKRLRTLSGITVQLPEGKRGGIREGGSCPT